MVASQARWITAADLARLPDDGFRHELVRGELRKTSFAGEQRGRAAMEVSWRLAQHVEAYHLGVVYAAGTGFWLTTQPDTVRAPDAAFVRQEHLDIQPVGDDFRSGAPDLALEVIEPDDVYSEVEEKVGEWLEAGTQMVLIINPRKHTVTVYRSLTEITILTEADQLNGDPVVPGWTVPVRDLFA